MGVNDIVIKKQDKNLLTGQSDLVAKYVMQRKCSSNTHLLSLFVSYATEMQLIEHDIIITK